MSGSKDDDFEPFDEAGSRSLPVDPDATQSSDNFFPAKAAPTPNGMMWDTISTQSTGNLPNFRSDDSLTSFQAIAQVGNFKVEQALGRGGMGVVYLARDNSLDRLVALKVLRSGKDAEPDELKRFEREAQIIAQIRHPHIVQVFEVGNSEGLVYLVLEYVNGGALSEYLDGTPLTENLAIKIVADLADALSAAHRKGVVHRDLKPGNVLVATEEADSHDARNANRRDSELLARSTTVFKLADFGLAKSIASDVGQTRTGALVGTPRYAAPEQMGSGFGEISPATDVYALGATLYELLTGAPAFRGSDLGELIAAVRTQDPLAPRLLNPQVSRDIETICLKCLEKQPAARYADATEVREELLRCLNGEPILARPSTKLERSAKWVRRHPLQTAVWTLSGLAVLVAIGLGISLVYQGQLRTTNLQLVRAQTDLNTTNEQLTATQSELEKRNAELNTKNAELQTAIAETQKARDLLTRFRYVIDMQLASRAWTEGDIPSLNKILERNYSVPDEIRGWEWPYLNGLAHSELGHLHGISASYSPSGKVLAVAQPGSVQILDGNSLAPIRSLDLDSSWPVRVAFSGDNKRLICSCAGDLTRVFDVASGDVVIDFRQHSYGGLVALNNDGTLALSTGYGNDRTVKLWRVDDGEILLDEFAGGGSYASSVAFSNDGKWFGIGWPPTTSLRLGNVLEPKDFVEVKLDQVTTYYSSLDPQVRFHPNSKSLLVSSGGDVYTVSLPADTDSILKDFDFNPVATGVKGSLLDVDPAGQILLTADSKDHSIAVWQSDPATRWNTVRGHVGDVEALSLQNPAAREDSRYVSVSVASNRMLWLRDCFLTPDFEQSFFAFRVSAIDINEDGSRIAAGGSDGHVAFSENGRPRVLSGATGIIWDIDFSPDGTLVAAASYAGDCWVWSVADGTLLHQLGMENEGIICSCIAFDSAGEKLAAGYGNGKVIVWDLGTGDRLEERSQGNQMLAGVAFQPSSGTLVSSSADGTVFWEPVKRVLGDVYAPDIRFSHDGAWFIARGGQVESDLILVDSSSGEKLKVLQGHEATASDAVFFADSSRLVSVGDTNGRAFGTGTLRIWDVETGQETLRINSGGARNVVVSDNGKVIATTTADGVVRIYRKDRFSDRVKAWMESR